MQKLKSIFRIILYLSIGFVIYYLAKFDFLIFGELEIDYTYFSVSVILLFVGFYVSSQSWMVALSAHKISISPQQAVYSHGISVFTKYIPGKIWVILGRASIVSEKGNSLLTCSTVSLKEQLVYLLLGLLISLTALPFLDINPLIILIVVFTALALSLFLFSKGVYDIVVHSFEKLLKKKLDIPYIGLKKVLSFSYVIVIYWIIWSVAFYILTKSIIPSIPVISAFAFPLSVCYGLLAVVIPGGIGIREGIIVLFLTALGVEPEIATTLSVIQRLWFISGEVFIFILAFINKNK